VQWTVTFWPFVGLGPVPALRISFSKPILLFSSDCLLDSTAFLWAAAFLL
jgi:hypothetical protein